MIVVINFLKVLWDAFQFFFELDLHSEYAPFSNR